MNLTIDNSVTIISALIAGILGIIGTLVVQYLFRKKRVVTWMIANQNYFAPDSFTEAPRNVPISVKIGNREVESLAVITIAIGNSGNEAITDFTLALTFGEVLSGEPGNPELIYYHPPRPLGEMSKHI